MDLKIIIGIPYTYKTGDYAPENYLKEKYPEKYNALQNKVAGDKVDDSGWVYVYKNSNVIDQSSKLYEVLFKGTTGEENEAKSYWLGSSKASVNGEYTYNCGPGRVFSGVIYTCRGLFDSRGLAFWECAAVRPVVYLQSTVTVEDLNISSTLSEHEWTTTLPQYALTGVRVGYGQIRGLEIRYKLVFLECILDF